jgi:hypothetical protein
MSLLRTEYSKTADSITTLLKSYCCWVSNSHLTCSYIPNRSFVIVRTMYSQEPMIGSKFGSKINLVRTLTFCFFKFHFNIILTRCGREDNVPASSKSPRFTETGCPG